MMIVIRLIRRPRPLVPITLNGLYRSLSGSRIVVREFSPQGIDMNPDRRGHRIGMDIPDIPWGRA